jgi:hypothetical protein
MQDSMILSARDRGNTIHSSSIEDKRKRDGDARHRPVRECGFGDKALRATVGDPKMANARQLGRKRSPEGRSAKGVRRDKAALSSGCKPHPAISLQPEATGAGMEETKCLKPSDSGSRIGDLRECAGRNVSER